MRFLDVLAQVVGLLVLEGRVSYRTLRLQFDLSDEHLDAIRVELIRVRELATDEGGEALVWIGGGQLAADPRGRPAPGESRAPPGSPVAPGGEPGPGRGRATDSPAASSVTLPSGASALDAERRQLTLMFCDLVGSTDLSGRLDPEDLSAVVHAYQEMAASAIRRFDGTIGQYLGDGILAYFGYPQAHEDDALRAAQAGLDIVEGLGALNGRLGAERGVELAVRVGIHTGPVVVGAVGEGSRQEPLALGEAPNIAARIQGVAEPNTVVISAATARLLRDAMELEALGAHRLKGVANPVPLARVIRPAESDGPDEEARAASRTRLLGRDEETGLLVRRWEQSKERLGQVVLISGEAGIGKSRLVETARAQAAHEGFAWNTYQCSPYHTGSAFYPVTTHLHRLLGFRRDEPAASRLAKLERRLETDRHAPEETVPLLARLLSIPLPESLHPLALTPQQLKQQTMDALVAWLIDVAERRALLTVWEDLHWADPSTLDLLGLLINQVPTAPMLTVLTYRPDFQPPWPMRSHMTPLTLNRLERPQVEAMIDELAHGKPLPAEVVHHIVAKTDGVPLFVEELTKTMLESGLIREDDARYTLTGPMVEVAIPATLQDSLMARLDRLPTVREVAQLGAVLGREFAYEMLRGVAAMDEGPLQSALAQLVSAELLYQRGRPPRAKYVFKHALIQDAAYASLLRSTRQRVHQQIAEMLVARFPETAATEPELVARHYTEAGCHPQAVAFWQKAGQRASERSANLEAVSHLVHGLGALASLPDSPERARQELALHLALGGPLIATRGYASPEIIDSTNRARDLVDHVGNTDQRFDVLYRQWVHPLVGAEYHPARSLAEEFLRRAEVEGDSGLILAGHRILGVSLLVLGELVDARAHFEHTLALYDPSRHRGLALRFGQDPQSAAQTFLALVLWLLGDPEEAARLSEAALATAQARAHFNTQAYAVFFGSLTLAVFRRDVETVERQAHALLALSEEQGAVFWKAYATIFAAWTQIERGDRVAGLARWSEGLADLAATGSGFFRPLLLALPAEALARDGEVAEGRRVLDEALALVQATGERFWEAEIHRLKGELLLAGEEPREAEADACLRQALATARRQEARALELRASMSLGRLWQRRGEHRAARELLTGTLPRLTQGADRAELAAARLLLDELTKATRG